MRKRFFFSLILILWLCGLLAACGEEATPAPSSPSPTTANATSAVTTGETTQTATLVPPTVAPATATPLPPSPNPTATPLPATATPVPTVIQKGDPVVGELPAPPEGRKLNFTLDMLQRLQKRLGGRPAATDLSGLAVGAYAATGQPVDVLDYYRAVMSQAGWTVSRKYNNLFGIYFEKGDQVAIVNATGVPDDSTVDFLAGFVPEVRGQVKGGEVLVLLGQGPPSVFELVKK